MASGEERVVVVTGAGGFIGRRCCEVFATDGSAVACLESDPSAGAPLVRAVGRETLDLVADLADAQQVEEVFKWILEWIPRVDVLVNMAGFDDSVAPVPFWEIDVARWEHVVARNLRATFLCSRAASVPMRQVRAGRIVNISSNTAVVGTPNYLHYNAAKAGIVGMTRGMARELGPYGIAVNAVAPGVVRTSAAERHVPLRLQQAAAEQCLPGPIEVDDVAEAVRFLASNRARMITGQTLLVNGGAAMGAF